MVHLPDVRLGSRPERRPGGGHPLPVLPGVREPPSVVRLVHRKAADLPLASDRVRAGKHHLHGNPQTPPPRADREGLCERLGRPADADPVRSAEAGVHARVDPPVLGGRGHRQAREQYRRRQAGELPAESPQQDSAAGDGGPQPPQSGDRELPRGGERGARGDQQPRGSRRRNASGGIFPGVLHRARRFHGGPTEEVLPPGTRSRGALALCLLHHLYRGGERRGGGGRRAQVYLRPGDARWRCPRWPQSEGDVALGVGGPRPRGRSAALRQAV